MAAFVPILALLSGSIALLGLLGAYSGVVAPMTGFTTFVGGALLGGLLTFVLSLIAIFLSRGGRNPDGMKLALAGLVAALGLLLVILVAANPGRGLPPINDITTDLENPPSFAPASVVPDYADRDMSYPEEFKAQVRDAYADLAPLRLSTPPAETYEKALATANDLGWTVAAQSPERGVFDAREETALFRFVDDITIRVTPDGAGSRVDIRSKSRDGRGDVGANAARIRRFLAALEG
jgi:uncharacterized protein (DUF1499 family)